LLGGRTFFCGTAEAERARYGASPAASAMNEMSAKLRHATMPPSNNAKPTMLNTVRTRDGLGGGIDSTGGKLEVGSMGIELEKCPSFSTDTRAESEVTDVGKGG
jgi:hypothetical protein